MQTKRHSTALFLTGLTSALLFGAATPAGKILLTSMHAQVLAGLLYVGSAIGVLPVVLTAKSIQPPWQAGRRTFLLLAGAILMGGILGPLLLLMGLSVAKAGSVSLWLNLEFVATVVLGHFVFREHLTMRGWIAAGGTVFAAVVLAGSEGEVGALSAFLVAAACLCWGFDNHFTALIDGITPAQTTLWKGLVAGAFNLTIGALLASDIGSINGILLALLVGAVSYGLSVTLYIHAAQGLGASRSQMVFSSAPFFGVLIAVVALEEPFTGTQGLAAGIIIASIVLLFTEKHIHAHRHDYLSHRHNHQHIDGHHNHRHEGKPTSAGHEHWHEHDPLKHDHKHWPDLHHRHRHTSDEIPDQAVKVDDEP